MWATGREGRRSPRHHRPADIQVVLVVLVVPVRATAVALVLGDRHLPMTPWLLAVQPLVQFGMALGAAPVALNAGAGFAQGFRFLGVV